MINSSIDLGSNTCLLLIARREENRLSVLTDQSRVVRLGQGVDQSGLLAPHAVLRTLEALKEYYELIPQYGGDLKNTRCVATASARGALILEESMKFLGFNTVQASSRGLRYALV